MICYGFSAETYRQKNKVHMKIYGFLQQSTHLLSLFSEANCKSKVTESTGVEQKEKNLTV